MSSEDRKNSMWHILGKDGEWHPAGYGLQTIAKLAEQKGYKPGDEVPIKLGFEKESKDKVLLQNDKELRIWAKPI